MSNKKHSKRGEKRTGSMKTRNIYNLVPVAALVAATFCAGCEDETRKPAAKASNEPPTVAAALLPTNGVEAATETLFKAPPPPPPLSPVVSNVVQLAQAGVGEEVLQAYVESSTNSVSLGVDEILYLNDVGVPVPVIAALLRHHEPQTSEPVAATESVASDALPTPQLTEAAAAVAPQSAPSAAPAASTAQTPTDTAPLYAPGTAPVAESYASTPVQVNYFYETLAPYRILGVSARIRVVLAAYCCLRQSQLASLL